MAKMKEWTVIRGLTSSQTAHALGRTAREALDAVDWSKVEEPEYEVTTEEVYPGIMRESDNPALMDPALVVDHDG